MLGNGTFATNSDAAYSYNDAVKFNEAQNHVQVGAATDINSQVDLIGYQAWKRAPQFFDTVAYLGDGTTNQTFSHNLGVKPSMIWLKNRSRNATNSTSTWVWVDDNITTLEGRMSSTADFGSDVIGTVTDTTVQTLYTNQYATNYNGDGYIAMLFGSLDGISKVGSYTGTGSDINVDCGFSNGASWVMVKCSSHAGSWQMYNTAFGNGIASGNDSFTEMEGAGGIQSSQDRIDPYSAGFTVPSTAGGDMNLSGRTYIFYAIAA
jgi:phosphoserine aminotransferase